MGLKGAACSNMSFWNNSDGVRFPRELLMPCPILYFGLIYAGVCGWGADERWYSMSM